MVRTQVYLSASDHRALKAEARKQGVSMTEIMRRIVGLHLSGRAGIAAFPKDAVLAFAALGRSGRDDTAEHHDDALDEAFRAGTVR